MQAINFYQPQVACHTCRITLDLGFTIQGGAGGPITAVKSPPPTFDDNCMKLDSASNRDCKYDRKRKVRSLNKSGRADVGDEPFQ
jgi:hypothetical protein